MGTASIIQPGATSDLDELRMVAWRSCKVKRLSSWQNNSKTFSKSFFLSIRSLSIKWIFRLLYFVILSHFFKQFMFMSFLPSPKKADNVNKQRGRSHSVENEAVDTNTSKQRSGLFFCVFFLPVMPWHTAANRRSPAHEWQQASGPNRRSRV